MSLPSNRLISVTINLTPTGVQAADFSTFFILGNNPAVIDQGQRFREYASLTEVGVDFATNTAEYQTALLYYSQNPQPTALTIGRWCPAGAGPIVYGDTLTAAQQAVSNFNTINNGAFSITINGVTTSFTGLNFTGVQSMFDVAAVFNAAMIGNAAIASVTWDTFFGALQITGINVSGATLSYGDLPRATGSIFFATNPANNATVTFNGTVVTFKTANPVGNQVLIGPTVENSVANLLNFCQASVDVNISQFIFQPSPGNFTLFLAAQVTGAAGNALTIAASAAAPSGATLSGGSGTDVSNLVQLTQAEGAREILGIGAESAVQAFQIIEGLTSFYGVVIAANQVTSDASYVALAAYIEADATPHIFGITTAETAALFLSDTSSIGYQLKQLDYNRTFVQFSTLSTFAAASIFGRMLTVDFTGSNTTIIVMYGTEPGVLPEPLTAPQANALDQNNYSYFATYSNGASILTNGTMASGVFFDTIQGTDWLANQLQTNVFNLFLQQKVPQTDAGTNQVVTVLNSGLEQGVTNGLLAPGTWNAKGFGKIVTGQFLPTGYYVYAPPISTQSEALRAERISVPIQIAAKGAGALQGANIALNFNP